MDVKKLAAKIDAAQIILDETRLESGCAVFGGPQRLARSREEVALDAATHALADRRARAEHFDSLRLFGEPAWDILLDLYIHQARQEAVTVKSAIIGSGASAVTVMRWLNALDQEGLVRSETDPTDDRQMLLRLTAEGYEAITRYLERVAR